MHSPDLQLREEMGDLVRNEQVDDLLSRIEAGLPLRSQHAFPSACPHRIVDLLLAYKDHRGKRHRAVFDAWVARAVRDVPVEHVHTQLSTLFLPAFTLMRTDEISLRLLLDAIERVMPTFLSTPVDETSLPPDIGLDGLRRSWASGQARRTPLGLAADSYMPGHYWASLLPSCVETMPAATTSIGLLEYLPETPDFATAAAVIRKRFTPKQEDLAKLGAQALRRLSGRVLPLVATGPLADRRYPPPKPSAAGAVVLLDAGATVSSEAWVTIATASVGVEDSKTPLPLLQALTRRLATKRNSSGLGYNTLKRILASGAVDINAALDDDRTTLLHVAAAGRNIHLIGLLIEHGADPKLKNVYGRCPVDAAVGAKAENIRMALRAAVARSAMTKAQAPTVQPR